VSDSQTPDSPETPEQSEPDAGERPPQGPSPARSFFANIEDGIGALFGAMEKGALDIAEAEGKKRRGDTGEAAEITEAGETDGTEAGDTAGAEVSNDAAKRSDVRAQRSSERSSEVDATEAPVREPRRGMTYDEILESRPRRVRRFVVGFVVAVVLAALYWLATLWQVTAASDDDAGTRVDAIELVGSPGYDAIAVLGAAQFDGTPSPVFQARLDRALELWNGRLASVIVTTGSNQEGDRFTEGFSGFVYLRENGVPEDAILTIIDGDDTYTQMTATLNEVDQRDLETVLLVSDGFHSYRLLEIADEIGLDAYVSPTGVEATRDDWIRETTAVSIGRIFGYRRLSAWG